MAEQTSSLKFEENFWGDGNKGFDVLLQNLKVGVGASKELREFIAERITVEESYVKGLSKLSRNVAAVPQPALGALGPMWTALHSMCDGLTSAHMQFMQLLHDVLREISEYHTVQKEKMRGNMKGEVEDAQDSLRLLETQEAALHRAKKLYTQSVEQLIRQQGKMEKVKGEANPKTKQQMEGRLKQAENWMETMKEDYKQAVETQTRQVMEFQANMHEACQKFGSIEEEHLAQMITFIIKMGQIQENVHIQVGKVHQKLNEQIDENSVEKLMSGFVESKGTGKKKPVPEKFRPVNPEALGALVALHVPSQDGHRLRSPSTDSQKALKHEKTLKQRMRFKKKGKGSKVASTDANNDHVISIPQEAIPTGEVDEEGFSIRPQDAAAIRGFPDDAPVQFSDDSDSEDEFQARVRQLHIRETSEDMPRATVDDIRASVQTLKIQHSPSTRIKKASSSQSLNTIISTPPMDRRAGGGDTSSASALDPAMSSLLDSDISLSPNVGMAAPLQPATLQPLPLLSTDPMQPLRPTAWSQQPAPLLPSPFSSPSSSATLPNSDSSSQTTATTADTNRPVPKPRRTSGGGEESRVPISSSPETSKKNSPSEPTKEGDVSVKVPSSGWMTNYSDEDQQSSLTFPPTMPSFPISPKSDSSSSSSDPDTQAAIFSPPVPNPRRSPRPRGTTPEQQVVSPLATSQRIASPVSVVATSPAVTLPTPTVTLSTPAATLQPTAQNATGIPLAIAFQETCNAIFKSTNPSDCAVKVTGEMVVSFPASFVSQVDTYERMDFQLKDTDRLKQVLHNQILLSRDGEGYKYHFNTAALSSHLRNMAEKKKNAPFYNMQIIKYEVDIPDGSQLPVRLAAYWKCTELVTNFRFDYCYVSANLPSDKKPPLTHVSVCVPVNGKVRNTLSKPSANWLADKQQIMWKLGDIVADDTQNSIHAKFDVSDGPSVPQPAVVKFICDGSTLSGVDIKLAGTGYRVSLLKKKYSSGTYLAEMDY